MSYNIFPIFLNLITILNSLLVMELLVDQVKSKYYLFDGESFVYTMFVFELLD